MRKLLLLCPLFLFSSCAKSLIGMAFKKSGVLDKTATLRPLKYNDKDIIFLDMVHLGTKEFYNDVSTKIDSLQKAGYFVFYEGLYLRKSDRIIKQQDTVNYLKFRKITGLDPLVEYSKMKPFSDYITQYQLIDQPDYIDLGITPQNSEPVDLSIPILMAEFEKAQGVVHLTPCDYESKLGSNMYNCGKADAEQRKYLLEDLTIDRRNENVVNHIKGSDKNKIVVVYGKKHYEGVDKLLQQ